MTHPVRHKTTANSEERNHDESYDNEVMFFYFRLIHHILPIIYHKNTVEFLL